jgi:TonB family protein
MKSESRTFRKAVALSIAVHIAIFGSALAFAKYAGGVFLNNGSVISVSLVSSGGGGGAVRRAGAETARRMPFNAMPQAVPVLDHASASAEATMIGETAASMAGSETTGSAAAGHGRGEEFGEANGLDGGQGGLSSEQWRMLQSAIEQSKTYPRLARERGIEGTVLVRFKVLPSGTVETVNVVRSSGASILDEASVTTVYRAAPLPFVSGWVEVPMSYILK